jgi:hypothetical protein
LPQFILNEPRLFPFLNGYFCCTRIIAQPLEAFFLTQCSYFLHIMKRRNFLQTGTFGIASFGLPTAAFSILQQQQGVHTWLRQLAEAASARRRSDLSGCPQQLIDLIGQTDVFLAGCGFERESRGTFFCAGGNTCFYPLLLRRASVNLTELLVPVFHRQTDGAWKRLAVLTGYQLEALGRAATALAEQHKSLQELLLPAGAIPATGDTFNTLRGAVTMKTQLKYGSAQTDITIYSGTEIIFTESYRSQHTLSSSPTRNA